jgi:predicted esterase
MKQILIVIILVFSAQWWLSDPTISASTSDISFKYIEKYSRDNIDQEPLPMIIALHGDGDSTDNFYETALNQLTTPVRVIVIASPINSRWPAEAGEFVQYGQALNEAVAALTEKFPTPKKPLLMGFSGGAEMAYYQALKFGRSYSYVFPVAGQLPQAKLNSAPNQPGAKVYAYHGKSDQAVSFSSGQQAAKTLQESGVNVRFTEFDDGHHGLFTSMKSSISKAIDKRTSTLL